MTRRGISAVFGSFSKAIPVLFSVLIFSCSVSLGQAINEDLNPPPKPKETNASSAARKTSLNGSVKKKNFTRSRKSIRYSPTAFNAKVRYSETPGQVFNRYTSVGQSSGVTVRDWKNVISQAARNSNPNTSRGQILLADGHLLLRRKRTFAAINQFKAAAQLMPLPVVYYSLGRAYLKNGQAKMAEEAFNEAIERNRSFALAYRGLGEAIVEQGDAKRAAKHFAKANELGATVP